jgi:hypothetical protein
LFRLIEHLSLPFQATRPCYALSGGIFRLFGASRRLAERNHALLPDWRASGRLERARLALKRQASQNRRPRQPPWIAA